MSLSQNNLLFIIPALPEYVPYVYNYFKMAEALGCDYDVVCWNRWGMEVTFPSNYTVYYHPTKDNYATFRKLREIYGFFRFVQRSIRGRSYKTIFTYTIADSIFFGLWLPRYYKKNYVFDIRDHSPLVETPVFRWFIKRLLKFSAINVISSDGFRKWLPRDYEYTVCHNTDLFKVRESIEMLNSRGIDESKGYRKKIKQGFTIITIGLIRDYDSNAAVVESFANQKGVMFYFAGSGGEKLKRYFKEKKIENVMFSGRYKKEDEDDIVQQADMVNLFLPHTMNSDTCMGNRMYLAARLRKPIIVTNNSWQAEVVKKYNLGICLEWGEDINKKIWDFWNNLNWNIFDEGCNSFLKQVENDMCIWEKKVKKIILS